MPGYQLSTSDSGVTSDDEPHTYFNQNGAQRKKKVRFADDCGKALELIRVMTEPSDFPPKINPAIIRRYRKAAKAFAASASSVSEKCNVLSTDEETSDDDEDELYSSKKHASWKIGFTQPASEYVKFRESLEKNKVALENVMLRNDHCKMLGTIKVSFYFLQYD